MTTQKPQETTLITHADYMAGTSSDPTLHQRYYAQFITASTRHFIKTSVGLAKLKKSKDPYFNDIIKHSNGGAGGWIWDCTPYNHELALQLGLCSKGYMPSMASRTCIGKACARILLAEEGV